MHQIFHPFFQVTVTVFFCNYMSVSFAFRGTWLKVVHSVASGLGQRVVIIDITSFDKPALYAPSDIGPSLTRGIPYSLLKPNKITKTDVK